MTFHVNLPACSKCAPLLGFRTSAVTPAQKLGSDPSTLGLSLGCNTFAAAVLGTCFYVAISRTRIATRGGVARATATKLDFSGKIEGDANGKVINRKANGPAVALAEPGRNGDEVYEEITFKVPSLLLTLLPSEMRSADPLERDSYLCTALEVGLKSLIVAADSKSPAGLFLQQQLQAVTELQNKWAEKVGMLDKQMTQIKDALHVDKKLQALRQETVDAKEAGTAEGVLFEVAGHEALVAIARIFGDRVEYTGSAGVSGTRRKRGNHVIHINQPGAGDLRLIVEQQAGASCAKNKLLGQMTEAMKLQEAQAAIGLIQRKSLGKTQAPYEQHGPKQIIVAVNQLGDSEETDSDWFALEVAYRTLRSQVVASAIQRHTLEGGGVNVKEVRARIKSVERELSAMRSVKLSATAARTSLEEIVSTVAELVQNVRKELTEMENALAEAASGERRRSP